MCQSGLYFVYFQTRFQKTIRTRIVGVKGEHADHLTPTKEVAPPSNVRAQFLQGPKICDFFWYNWLDAYPAGYTSGDER